MPIRAWLVSVNANLGKPELPCDRLAQRWGKLDCANSSCSLDDKVAAVVAKHGGEGASVKKCPMKGHARMTNKLKAADDHRYEAKPRPAKNIDIVRTCVTLARPKDLIAVAQALCSAFYGNGVARAKNMFAFSEERAAVQFHYRTLMLNLLMAPDGLTYGALAAEAAEAWDAYVQRRPDNPAVSWAVWRMRAGAALAHLRSDAVKAVPVRMIVEVQLLLKPYLEARQKMHLLYKVVRAASAVASRARAGPIGIGAS